MVHLVRSRRSRGQPITGFFLAGMLALGCIPTARPSAAVPSVAVGSSCASQAAAHGHDVARVPFGIYSAATTDFARLAHNGLTMVGPWYVPAPDRALLDAASAAGLGVIFPIGDPQGREREVFAQTQGETQAMISVRVREVVDHPAVVAWYLLPEELRPWDPDERAYLRTATAAIRAADPHGRPVLSYQPNHHDRVALAPVIAHLDIATKGTYTNYTGHRDARAWVRWSVDEAEAAGDAPAWLVPEMFAEAPNANAEVIAAWVRHDVYAGLVAGATGVLVYSGFRRQNFAQFDAYLAAYEAVAGELNGPLGLGEVLLGGAVCPGDPITVIGGETEATFAVGGVAHHVPSIARRVFEHQGAQWLWLVNSSGAPQSVHAPDWASATIVGESRGVGHQGAIIRVPAWGVAVMRRQ